MKYEKLYGLSSQKLAEKFGVSRQRISQLHQDDRLAEYIANGGRMPYKEYGSFYRRIYGRSGKELATQLGCSAGSIVNWHRLGVLEERLRYGNGKRKVHICKMRRKYGFSGKELAKMTGKSVSVIYYSERTGKLEEFLKKCEKFRRS